MFSQAFYKYDGYRKFSNSSSYLRNVEERSDLGILEDRFRKSKGRIMAKYLKFLSSYSVSKKKIIEYCTNLYVQRCGTCKNLEPNSLKEDLHNVVQVIVTTVTTATTSVILWSQ